MERYDEWLDIVKRHQLKWSSPNNTVNVFRSFIDSQIDRKDIEGMIIWIKRICSNLSKEYRNILLSNTLTGLRPDEAQKAIHLIKTKEK